MKAPLLRAAAVCFLLAAVFLSILLFAGCSVSRTGRVLNVGIGIAGVADLVTTHQGLARGARELNPLMRGSEWQRWALKGAGLGGIVWLTHSLESRQSGIAQILRAVAVAIQVAVSVQNHQVSQ